MVSITKIVTEIVTSQFRFLKLPDWDLSFKADNFINILEFTDHLCGLVVRVLGHRSGGPGSIPGTTRKNVVGLERGPLSLMSTTEELLDRKVAAPV
jgi:hypothetical protein